MIDRAKNIVEEEARAIAALASQFDESLEEIVDQLLACQGHVLTLGAGTSRAVAQRFAHLLSCCGVPALALSGADALHGGSGAITSKDLLFVISKGGVSEEINQIAGIAREHGATVIAQTEDGNSPLAMLSNFVFLIKTVGEVDPYGVMSLGTSLVHSAAGDVLCRLALEKNGYSLEAFGRTHPGGLAGKKLAEGQE